MNIKQQHGWTSIISLNQNLVSNHIKVLIVIKLDHGREQSSMGFHIAWIIQSSIFGLIKSIKHYFFKTIKERGEHYSQLTLIHFPVYKLFKVKDAMGNND